MPERKLPGGASGYVDSFARDHLPPENEWAEMDYASLPELVAHLRGADDQLAVFMSDRDNTE